MSDDSLSTSKAIDLLMARFRHRLRGFEEAGGDQPIGSFPASAA
jgi:hypothetical protein